MLLVCLAFIVPALGAFSGTVAVLSSRAAPLAETRPKTVSVESQVERVRSLYQEAKRVFMSANQQEGAASLPQLKEARRLLEEALVILQKIRDDFDAREEREVAEGHSRVIDPSAGCNTFGGGGDLETDVIQLLIMCRSALRARP